LNAESRPKAAPGPIAREDRNCASRRDLGQSEPDPLAAELEAATRAILARWRSDRLSRGEQLSFSFGRVR
jgi:hypothetical protein